MPPGGTKISTEYTGLYRASPLDSAGVLFSKITQYQAVMHFDPLDSTGLTNRAYKYFVANPGKVQGDKAAMR